MNTASMTIAVALNTAHHQLMESDPRIVVIGEDIVGGAGLGGSELGGVFGVTAGLAAKFGKSRVIDTPISETAFVGMGIGAAMTGLKPIVEVMFCDFIGVCFDQILNQAAKTRFLSNDRIEMPLVIRTTMGAGDGSGAMHSQSLHAMLASIPGLIVVCPSTPADTAGLLKSALQSPDPVIMLEHKGLYGVAGNVQPDLPSTPIGKGRCLQAGDDITVVAIGEMLARCQKAATQLAARGIGLDLIDPRTVQPLDIAMILTSVAKTRRLLVVDEGPLYGGFADQVIAAVACEGFGHLRASPQKLTPPHTPTPYGRLLEAAWLPDANAIVKKIDEMMYDE
jgi:acetoin:2,6-dichlorophenolindophenol oxidoreductase subunit beta